MSRKFYERFYKLVVVIHYCCKAYDKWQRCVLEPVFLQDGIAYCLPVVFIQIQRVIIELKKASVYGVAIFVSVMGEFFTDDNFMIEIILCGFK